MSENETKSTTSEMQNNQKKEHRENTHRDSQQNRDYHRDNNRDNHRDNHRDNRNSNYQTNNHRRPFTNNIQNAILSAQFGEDTAGIPQLDMVTFTSKSYTDLMLELNELLPDEAYAGASKQEIIFSILREKCLKGNILKTNGVLEVMGDGFGFLRSQIYNYSPQATDVYVSPQLIKRFGLRQGDTIICLAREPKPKEKYFSLAKIISINDQEFGSNFRRPANFDSATPIFPKEMLKLETPQIQGKKKDFSNNVIEIICPLGKGQRALIVAPPRVGKTILMQSIAHAIAKNHPEVELIYLGIDERPEELTDMSRSIKGEVVASTFDEQYSRHVSLAEIVIEKAKRRVEMGKDVVILLDSITRLARAYNNVLPSSGKVLTGGVDANALQAPKRFFGAARNLENGGSLTIIATALIDTGSRMDEVIFEEFKGTGNSEIVLDRKLADKRIFPAIDILKSGTRKEDEMISADVLTKMWVLRRILSGMSSVDAMEFLLEKLEKCETNADFFKMMNQ